MYSKSQPCIRCLPHSSTFFAPFQPFFLPPCFQVWSIHFVQNRQHFATSPTFLLFPAIDWSMVDCVRKRLFLLRHKFSTNRLTSRTLNSDHGPPHFAKHVAEMKSFNAFLTTLCSPVDIPSVTTTLRILFLRLLFFYSLPF